jgi:hypothetical protein
MLQGFPQRRNFSFLKALLGRPGTCGDVQCCTWHCAGYPAYNAHCRSCSNETNPSGTLCSDGHFSANPACCPCICRHVILSPYFSVGTLGRSRRRRRPWPRRPRDALRVRSLYLDRQAFQPLPVFEPGSSPAPHCCFKAMLRCGRRHPDDPSRGGPAGDVMAGAGGAAGPAPDVRHQPAGDVHPQFRINLTNTTQKSSKHQRWWCSGMNSHAVCVRFWVRIWRFSLFCQF